MTANLLSPSDFANLLKVSRTTLFGLKSSGRLPQPIKLSARVIRWRADEIQRWIDAGAPPLVRWEGMQGVRHD